MTAAASTAAEIHGNQKRESNSSRFDVILCGYYIFRQSPSFLMRVRHGFSAQIRSIAGYAGGTTLLGGRLSRRAIAGNASGHSLHADAEVGGGAHVNGSVADL